MQSALWRGYIVLSHHVQQKFKVEYILLRGSRLTNLGFGDETHAQPVWQARTDCDREELTGRRSITHARAENKKKRKSDVVGRILAAGFGFYTCALGIHCMVNTSLQSDESISSCQSAALVQMNDVLWLREGSILKSISQSRGCNQLAEDTHETIQILMMLKYLVIDLLNKNWVS